MPLPSACLNVRPMAITSPTRFHLRAEHGLCAGKFLKLPARDFDDDVIDGGFKASRRCARNVVMDFIQAIANGKLRGDFRNREIRWLSTPARNCATRADSFPR